MMIDATAFIDHFKVYVAKWRQRCAPVDEYRELQRNRRITVSSKTLFEEKKR